MLTKQEGWRPKQNGLGFESIEPHNVSLLERPSEESEVHGMVRKMVKDKTLGPDGFSMRFFQSCWDVVKEDLMKVFQELFYVGKFEKSLNATFLVLILRRSGHQRFSIFGPLLL